MASSLRRVGVVLAFLAALAFAVLGANSWWSQGQREDQAVWAHVKEQTTWLAAILQPESKGLNPPCGDKLKMASLTGKVIAGDSARGESLMREAQNRLLREGWYVSGRDKVDIGDGLGARQRDSFGRTISGRVATITFVGKEETDRPAGVYRPPLDSPGVMITMEPKFCGI